jgi:hypothetical protein
MSTEGYGEKRRIGLLEGEVVSSEELEPSPIKQPTNWLEFNPSMQDMVRRMFERALAKAETMSPPNAAEANAVCIENYHNGRRYGVQFSILIGPIEQKLSS